MVKLETYHYIIALGTLIGFIRFLWLDPVLKSLPFFLLLTLFVELATPLHLIRFHGNNNWFFNIFTTIEFLFYSFVFYHLIQSTSLKKTVAITAVLFLVFTWINIF